MIKLMTLYVLVKLKNRVIEVVKQYAMTHSAMNVQIMSILPPITYPGPSAKINTTVTQPNPIMGQVSMRSYVQDIITTHVLTGC